MLVLKNKISSYYGLQRRALPQFGNLMLCPPGAVVI